MTEIRPLPFASAHDDRTAEILARIRTVFAEKGFDGASMQDLARAAGMSVGNFYRYFPSKAAIVEAMVGFDMAEIQRDFTAIDASGDPLAAMRAKIAEHVRESCAEESQLWSEITAAAHRKAEIAQICCGMEDMVAENLLGLFARITGLAPAAVRHRFLPQARFIVLMIKAASTRRPGPPDTDLDALILRSIDAVLDDVTCLSALAQPFAKA